MAFPYFFEENPPLSGEFFLSEETSRHIGQVLRMKAGDEMIITNGKGYLLNGIVISASKKKTIVNITNHTYLEKTHPPIAIAISLVKNNSRFESFVEKATEIGISSIIPLLCKRTEKTHFKMERIRSILISAMLQSQQTWLPELREPHKISQVIKSEKHEQKFIAHCANGEKQDLKNFTNKNSSKIILIGPEGDFTEEEISSAIAQNYVPVTLGDTRLRTETAGIVAAVLLK